MGLARHRPSARRVALAYALAGIFMGLALAHPWFNIGDWLYTQWTVEPILRAVGHLGWWPTHVACLFAAACLGQAVATRHRHVALPCAVVAVGLLLVPPLPSNGTELLRGIVAVHTTSTVALPHAEPPRAGVDDPIELFIWPEAAFQRALVAEGRRAGGELLVVVARDEIMVNDRAKRQLPAVQLLRSVEYGVPSTRASHGGRANFVSSDGRVLAVSDDTRNGRHRA